MPHLAATPDAVPAFIGTAGWSIAKQYAAQFPPADSVLERYARRFNCVEINSSFYRPHRRTTYERWAAATPETFRFSVKLPKEITHRLKLRDAGAPLDRFLQEVAGLGGRLGPILAQLPPSLLFDSDVADSFFALIRHLGAGAVMCEPRHPTWFTSEASQLLESHSVGRVTADPPPCPAAGYFDPSRPSPYHRLHGSPRIYYSDYSETLLSKLADTLAKQGGGWCIFDNTAAGAATGNALRLGELLSDHH